MLASGHRVSRWNQWRLEGAEQDRRADLDGHAGRRMSDARGEPAAGARMVSARRDAKGAAGDADAAAAQAAAMRRDAERLRRRVEAASAE